MWISRKTTILAFGRDCRDTMVRRWARVYAGPPCSGQWCWSHVSVWPTGPSAGDCLGERWDL